MRAFRGSTFLFRVIIAGFAGHLLPGCVLLEPFTPTERTPPPPRNPAPARPADSPPPKLAPAGPVMAGRALVYPVRNTRADELAETLLPILQARYGPEARIVAHLPTNQLLIYVPDDSRPAAASGVPGPQGAPGTPPVSAPPPSTREASRSGTRGRGAAPR